MGTITDMDRLNAVQHKLFEVKSWVDETLRILNYVCIDEDHKAFKRSNNDNNITTTDEASSKANGLYPGQLADTTFQAKEEEDIECSS